MNLMTNETVPMSADRAIDVGGWDALVHDVQKHSKKGRSASWVEVGGAKVRRATRHRDQGYLTKGESTVDI